MKPKYDLKGKKINKPKTLQEELIYFCKSKLLYIIQKLSEEKK